jgi:triosephosphate isomerase
LGDENNDVIINTGDNLLSLIINENTGRQEKNMRKPFVAGNWKMNTDINSGVALVTGIADHTSSIAGDSVDVAVIPPFVYINQIVKQLSGVKIAAGAQDLYFEQKGAFTGEISSDMLKDVGCTYVLCGHSERRHVIGETDELINKKVCAAVSGGLLPILCVGETIGQRQAEKTEQIVGTQVREGLNGLDVERVQAVTIAYEPVWAIGTGCTATTEQAQEVHCFIRGLLAELYDEQTSQKIRIQYGGSVKPGNARELMAQPDIDGALVGGASLKVEDFVAIIKAAI